MSNQEPHRVTLISGDGIGPEIVKSAQEVIESTGVRIEWEEVKAGQCAISEFGHPVPESVLDSIKRTHATLKGPMSNIRGTEFPGPNGYIRRTLGLYANVRFARSFAGVKTFYPNTDIVVVRETTEDVYRGQEQMIGKDAAVAIKFITREGARRVISFAFDFASRENREKVTVVLKANVLRLTDGLFLEEARSISQNFPNIEFEEMNVDAQCLELVRKPQEYDVLVMPNLYGDIISDLAGGLVGSVGLCPGVNIGEDISVFEAAHGSAPKYAGLNKVNPTAMILSGALMLEYLGENDNALKIRKAVSEVLVDGDYLTYDLGGTTSTTQMTGAIVNKIETVL
ncbi:MAG: isocitrate/isopropylmalate dehydrogenase family protein [Desulfobacterales bacterium]|nr:isocitrate/isopropylmalate dehydrogenase family protein [Desulfobacterales bacterium]